MQQDAVVEIAARSQEPEAECDAEPVPPGPVGGPVPAAPAPAAGGAPSMFATVWRSIAVLRALRRQPREPSLPVSRVELSP
jgi:hypothetical protein